MRTVNNASTYIANWAKMLIVRFGDSSVCCALKLQGSPVRYMFTGAAGGNTRGARKEVSSEQTRHNFDRALWIMTILGPAAQYILFAKFPLSAPLSRGQCPAARLSLETVTS